MSELPELSELSTDAAATTAGYPLRLLQGYLWYPKTLTLDLADHLPSILADAHLLIDEIQPPFAFFENGTLTSSQHFFQVTVLSMYPAKPSEAEMHAHTARFSAALDPLLNATPAGVGWQLWEDLRPIE